MATPFTVPLEGTASIGALDYPAAAAEATEAPGTTLILAHGAGAPQQTHPFMTAFARGLSSRGIAVVTFNFLYRETHGDH